MIADFEEGEFDINPTTLNVNLTTARVRGHYMRIDESVYLWGYVTRDPVIAGYWDLGFSSPVGTPVSFKIGGGGAITDNSTTIEPLLVGGGSFGSQLGICGVASAAMLGSYSGFFNMSYKIA